MRNQKLFQVDAFAEEVFQGNPAAVVVTAEELPVSLMQSIANENNLAETAFVFGDPEMLTIRWFTPTVEVDLCGHATLAAAHVLMTEYQMNDRLTFQSKSGPLNVQSEDSMLWLDFPADSFDQSDHHTTRKVEQALNCNVVSVYRGKSDLMAVLESQEVLTHLEPTMDDISKLNCRGVIVTAAGNEVDFVSRFFAPQVGVPEDPVTGSAHTTLIPYWSERLQKDDLRARQLSFRGGSLSCVMHTDRVRIGGHAITYLSGSISI